METKARVTLIKEATTTDEEEELGDKKVLQQMHIGPRFADRETDYADNDKIINASSSFQGMDRDLKIMI